MHTIIVVPGKKEYAPLVAPIRALAQNIAKKLVKKPAHLEIYLVGNDHMKKNVLSFQSPKVITRPDVHGTFLGEIYLNPTYIRAHRESLEFMLVHGFLHVLGYTHERARDTIDMERMEQKLCATFGIRQ